MATTPEGKVKKMVRDVLDPYRDRGELTYDMVVPTGYGPTMLDFVGNHMGRYFEIETKAPGKHPTDRQTDRINRVRAAKGKVFVIDSAEELKPLKAWLNGLVD